MTNELRTWIEQQLDAGAGALDLSQDDPDDEDEDEEFTSSDDELDESDELEADEDDDETEEQEQGPYRPPTAPALVEAVLAGELDLGGMAADEWFSWAVSASPDEWAKAAAQSGFPDAEQPRAHHLPDALRVGLMQQDLDARIAAAREGRR